MMEEKSSLQHYASPYYDPVKAHEYYMRTRELKGRRSTTKLNEEGKKVWSYTKKSITEEKKADIEEEKEKRDQKIEALRAKTAETKEHISAKLKSLNEALSEQASKEKEATDTERDSKIKEITATAESQRKQIAAEREATLKEIEEEAEKKRQEITKKRESQIAQLEEKEIPKSLPDDVRAKMIEQRNEKISKLRDDANDEFMKVSNEANDKKSAALVKFTTDLSAVNQKEYLDIENARTAASERKGQITEDTKKERTANSEDAKQKRERASNSLKSAIAAAREAYSAAKESLDESYEEIYQREFDRIEAEYGKNK